MGFLHMLYSFTLKIKCKLTCFSYWLYIQLSKDKWQLIVPAWLFVCSFKKHENKKRIKKSWSQYIGSLCRMCPTKGVTSILAPYQAVNLGFLRKWSIQGVYTKYTTRQGAGYSFWKENYLISSHNEHIPSYWANNNWNNPEERESVQ